MNLLAFVGVIIFDGYFLGQIGTSALAGASLAFNFVMMVLHSTNSGMGASVSSAVARAIGAGQQERAYQLVFHAFVLVTMVGTNWGAGQFQRARRIVRTGSILSAASCAIIGLIVFVYPSLWVGLFSDEPEVLRVGALYLQTVGPVDWCFGLGLGFVLYAALLSYNLQQIENPQS